MLAAMERTPDSSRDLVADFLTTGRTGRRNAMADILGEHAKTSSGDLPDQLERLTTTDPKSSGTSSSSEATSSSSGAGAVAAPASSGTGAATGSSSCGTGANADSGRVASKASAEAGATGSDAKASR